MEPSIVTLAGLTAGDVTALSTTTSSQDIMLLDMADIVAIVPTATVILWRRCHV
jgi:hypothetical protein